jgi:uncharacterized membrane protein
MRIGIGEILLMIQIVVFCSVVIIYALHKKRQENIKSVRFTAMSCHIERLFDELKGTVIASNGHLMTLVNELRDYRREFNLTFNTELAGKVEAILHAGETKDGMMKKMNESGETEWVPIDHGW